MIVQTTMNHPSEHLTSQFHLPKPMNLNRSPKLSFTRVVPLHHCFSTTSIFSSIFRATAAFTVIRHQFIKKCAKTLHTTLTPQHLFVLVATIFGVSLSPLSLPPLLAFAAAEMLTLLLLLLTVTQLLRPSSPSSGPQLSEQRWTTTRNFTHKNDVATIFSLRTITDRYLLQNYSLCCSPRDWTPHAT